MKYTKHFSVTVLVLLVLLLTTVTFAYWAGSIDLEANAPVNQTVTIGQGTEVKTKLTITGNDKKGTLVPADFAKAADGTVGELEFNYTVKWDGEAGAIDAAATGTITGEYVSAKNAADQDLRKDLFVVTIEPTGTGSEISLRGQANFKVTVKMNEPENKDEYKSVANQDIALNLNFAVTGQEEGN